MQLTCTACNINFQCEVEKATNCWCAQLPTVLPIEEVTSCLCPSCLQERTKAAIQQYVEEVKLGIRKNEATKYVENTQKMAEGIDYYLENGLLVMSSWYHLKRGYCCGSGCRHCPYK